MHPQRIGILVAVAVVAITMFLPWAVIHLSDEVPEAAKAQVRANLGNQADGINVTIPGNDDVAVFVLLGPCLLAAAVCCFIGRLPDPLGDPLKWTTLSAGGVGALVMIWWLVNASAELDKANERIPSSLADMMSLGIGIGAWISLVGMVGIAGTILATLSAKPEEELDEDGYPIRRGGGRGRGRGGRAGGRGGRPGGGGGGRPGMKKKRRRPGGGTGMMVPPSARPPQHQPQPGYGHHPQQPGYPPQQGGYPPQQPGYPSQQPGYPPQQPGGYPPQHQQPAGYPPQQPGYPQQPPQQQPGYPPQQQRPAAYPPQQGGYPPQQQGGGGYPPQYQHPDPDGPRRRKKKKRRRPPEH